MDRVSPVPVPVTSAVARPLMPPARQLPSRRRAVARWIAWGLATGVLPLPALTRALAAAPESAARAGRAPLLPGLDGHHFALESMQPLVRRYFDQGMLLVFGFNPAEAARSFEAALALDRTCATAWWALAWALGPNINTDMAPQDAPRVAHALRQARRHAHRAAPVQRGLIAALSRRHPDGADLDEDGYAQTMQELARRHPRAAQVALLAAEALLNLHPYDWWTSEGAPQPWTPAIEELLQRALALDPRHPGAHHYWVHLQESSPHPARAQASADALRDLVPGSGHLLHMPAHIDMRTGRFDDAISASQRSIAADQRYLDQVDAQGAYRVGYVAHNHHFLWAAAAMAGRMPLALQAAEAALPAACGPTGRDPGSAIAQHYRVLPYFTLLRFGQWDTLLRGTAPPDGNAPYPLAIWHCARGMALARTGALAAAQAELERLERLAGDPALVAWKLKNINPAASITRIAVLSLRAELAWAGAGPLPAVALLREATRSEDALAADEPHLWLAPTRHALGAALLAAGQPAEAAQVYREDLQHYPGNGWSLGGLALALQQLGQAAAARQAARQAEGAFAQAERRPTGSRF